MAQQKILGQEKVVEITCMSVAGGELDLEKGLKYFVNVRLDYSSVAEDELIGLASEGSSVRVKAQAKLRQNAALLKEKGVIAESAGEASPEEWITFDVATDFEKAERGPKDPVKAGRSAFAKMSEEQKIEFIMVTMGVTEDEASAMVGR